MIASARRILKGRYLIMSLLLCVALPTQAQWFNWFSADEPLQVTVDDAFINVYSGPGRGYPIFHVVEREEVITLLYSRTDWIKIKTKRGIQGWIKRDDMKLTLSPDGSKPDFPDNQQADYLVDRFELGTAYGDFAGADSLTINLGYRFTKNLSAEVRYGENTGQFLRTGGGGVVGGGERGGAAVGNRSEFADAGQRERTDGHRPEGIGDVLTQTAHVAHVLLAIDGVDDGTGT